MISVSNLSFSHDGKQNLSFPDFSISKGMHTLLLGDSGSGKTTLLHLIGGLLRKYSGSIQVNGNELSQLSESQLDHFRGRNIGFIFQKNHLVSALTVEQNLLLAPYLAGVESDKARMNHVLQELSIHEKSASRVTSLSHGQAQRVAIARAVLNHPPIILADEPTSALDDTNCNRVIDLLLRIASANEATLVVATHDQRLKDKISGQVILSKP